MTEPDHSARDRHLFGPGPKRILALDGGGVRGVISVAFLERIEAILRAHHGNDVVLSSWFDLIGGTSTGAVIGGALGFGKSTAELKHIYHTLAPRVFRKSRFRIPLLQPKFDVTALRREIAEIVGDRTLDSADLLTGFGVVAKRTDTGSLWIVANNPRAPYWETPRERLSQPTATTPARQVVPRTTPAQMLIMVKPGWATSFSKITSGESDISYGSRKRATAT